MTSKELRLLRAQAGWNQRTAAIRGEMSPAAIYAIEHGRKAITDRRLLAYVTKLQRAIQEKSHD